MYHRLTGEGSLEEALLVVISEAVDAFVEGVLQGFLM